MLWYRNRTISWTALVVHFCVLLPNIMNINDCNTWQLSATRCGNCIRLLFPRSHESLWFDSREMSRFAFETYHLVLQNRRKFTIDYRIESAAHYRLYHRLLQLKFLKATSYWVFIYYALSIIKQYIFTFIQ